MLPRILPIIISQPVVISKSKVYQEKYKEKAFFITGDNLKPKRVKRRPLRLPPIVRNSSPCDCNLMHLTRVVLTYAPKSRKRGASNTLLSTTTWGTTGQMKRMKNNPVQKKLRRRVEKCLIYENDEYFKRLEVKLIVF